MTELVLVRGRGTIESGRSAALGILSLASYLENKGFGVEIIDRNCSHMSIEETLKEIEELHPRFIGFSALTNQATDILSLAKVCQARLKCKLIFGGLHFSACPEEALNLGGIVIKGEGENALLDLCQGKNINSKIVRGSPLEDIDDIPIPPPKFLNRTIWSSTEYLMMTSRGCPYTCYFCLKSEFKRGGIRFHSIDYICRYIEYLMHRYRVKTFFFMDDILTVNRERVIGLCREIKRRKIKASFKCFGHVNFLDEDVLSLMKKAGFYQVQIGVESGDQELLDKLGKHIDLGKVREGVRKIRKAGLDVVTLFMIGNITETEESIKKTIDFARELGAKNWFSYAIPFPGSQFYEEAEKFGQIVEKDISKWGNETLVFIPSGLNRSQMEDFMRQARELPSEFNFISSQNWLQKIIHFLRRLFHR